MKWLANLYRALWSRIGGRPWTFILRDTWHQVEALWIFGLVLAGMGLQHWLPTMAPCLLLAFGLGYVAGHLFWGKKYIPDQQGGR